MTNYQRVKQYLENEPRARERSLRARGLVNLLLQDYADLRENPKETLIAFARDFESYNREWRAVMEQCEELRGFDYSDKVTLEAEKQLELGYEPNFKQSVDKLSRLV